MDLKRFKRVSDDIQDNVVLESKGPHYNGDWDAFFNEMEEYGYTADEILKRVGDEIGVKGRRDFINWCVWYAALDAFVDYWERGHRKKFQEYMREHDWSLIEFSNKVMWSVEGKMRGLSDMGKDRVVKLLNHFLDMDESERYVDE